MTSSTVGKDDGALRAHKETSDVTEGVCTECSVRDALQIARNRILGLGLMAGGRDASHNEQSIFPRIDAAIEYNTWKPIDLAPTDGTRIQGGHFDIDGSFRQFVCFWNPRWAGVGDVPPEGPFWQAGGLVEHPTHWKHLQEGPRPLDVYVSLPPVSVFA